MKLLLKALLNIKLMSTKSCLGCFIPPNRLQITKISKSYPAKFCMAAKIRNLYEIDKASTACSTSTFAFFYAFSSELQLGS